MQGRDPRFGQQPYSPPPSPPSPQGPQGPYAQQPLYGQPAPHAAYAPHGVYVPPPARAPTNAPAPGWGGQLAAPAGGLPLPGGLGNVAPLRGLPAPVAFVLGLVAVAVALVFDVVFLKVSIPGVGGYAWYLSTALSFAGAGWASITWTRASKTVAMTAVAMAAGIYGVADLGLGLVLEDLSMASAIVLGAQGVGIGVFTGFGGVFKAMRERE